MRQSLPHRNVQEIVTWQKDREFYLGEGYPTEVAEQYAWDHYYYPKMHTYTEAL